MRPAARRLQELLGKPGLINGILALDCTCDTLDRLGRIRPEIARILRFRGHTVSGSDTHLSHLTTELENLGVTVHEGHSPQNIDDAQLVVYTSAAHEDNPELQEARARGIETYFLNFARSTHAEEVAARENAISPATLKDLQNLVKAIALNSKIDESRDFAAAVQENMVSGVRAERAALDRGVHTAPFYVLIGANMPSILAEIAFVSHPGDEKLLRSGDYRETIARSLLQGVRSYLDTLNRTPSRALTAASGRTKVMERSKSR